MNVSNRVVFLELSEERAKERLCLRRLDPVTGEQYHLLYNPPPTQEIKDRLETVSDNTRNNFGMTFLFCNRILRTQ